MSVSVTGSSHVPPLTSSPAPSPASTSASDHQGASTSTGGRHEFQDALNGRAKDGLPLKSFRAPKPMVQTAPMYDPANVPADVKQAAQGMESMFLSQMYKAMRKTVPKSKMSLDSNASKIYQGMLDWEYAQTAAKTGGVGLSDLVIAYLMRKSYNGNRTRPNAYVPAVQTKESRSKRGSTQAEGSNLEISDTVGDRKERVTGATSVGARSTGGTDESESF